MADYRYRSGRRSPTYNPARASLPLSVGYSSPYGGDIHAMPSARYETAGPRRQSTHPHHAAATATVTTYNVTKDPLTRSTSVRDNSRTRHRSTTFDTGSGTVKPIIVTTNHARPHNPTSHASSGRSGSPTRDPYRASQEMYYAQPASSIRSRSHQRHYSATLDNDEFYRLRERVGGDDRLQPPLRPHSRQSLYVNPPRISSAAPDFGLEDYEYTKPSDLARYDLDHDRPRSRTSRRDSVDRGGYYRPTVSVVSSDVSRPEGRRGPPPASVGLERYNRKAAAGIYDRPSVIMPTLPAVPPPPPIDPARRSGLLDAPGSPSAERRSSRPRPVSLYQEAAPRMSQGDDVYRAREDDRGHRERRDRERADDLFRADSIASRGFGIRPELLEQVDHRRGNEPERRDYDDRRVRREPDEREPRRRSDEDLDRVRSHDERKGSEVKDRPARAEESRERKDSKDNGRGDKVRDKVVAGLGVAAAAIGLGSVAKDKEEDKEGRVSPRRRRDSEVDLEPVGSRPADRYKPREKDIERKSSPREEPIVVEQRRDSKKDRVDAREESATRERDSGREVERESERDRDFNRREAESMLTGTKIEARDDSPKSDDSAGAPGRRRLRPSSAFNPTDTKGLMDLKAQLAAMGDDDNPKEKERPIVRDRVTEADTVVSTGSDKQSVPVRERERERPRDESRGRDLAIVDPEVKQVRVVSPPRDKADQKPVRGILKQPKPQFPEEPNPIREGVAPHKDDKTKKDVPPGARWTKINRKMVNPEALTIGKERFEVRDDFVIVLRVLSKEEIQAYATATAQLRERRRLELEKDNDVDEKDGGRDRDDEERKRRHRHRREREEEDDDRRDRDRDRDGDKERHRRRRHDDYAEEEEAPRAIEYDDHSSHHHHHRSHRDKDRESATISTDDRR